MLRKRLKKYLHLSQSAINQGQKLKGLGSTPAEKTIKAAFLHVKKGDYDQEDREKMDHLVKYAEDLKTNPTAISYEIFNIDNKPKVSEIAKNAGSPQKWCELFYFLTKFSKAKNILEIGTNLGISGQYFLSALTSKDSSFTTLEGVEGLCDLASGRFGELADHSKFRVVQGFYDSTLPKIASTGGEFDLVFFDGNHKFEPTLHYFNILKENYSENAILIFDDIYWSREMEKAWKSLRKVEGVYCSIDFFKLGILLFDPSKKHLPKKQLKLSLGF